MWIRFHDGVVICLHIADNTTNYTASTGAIILQQLVQLNEGMADVERSMQFTSDRLESAVTTLLPAITAHMSQLAEGLLRRQLELEVHRKKWNLVIHGVEGTEKEDEAVTRQGFRSFAKEFLRVEDADATVFAACHIASRISATQESSSASWTLHSVTNACRVPRTLNTITNKNFNFSRPPLCPETRQRWTFVGALQVAPAD